MAEIYTPAQRKLFEEKADELNLSPEMRKYLSGEAETLEDARKAQIPLLPEDNQELPPGPNRAAKSDSLNITEGIGGLEQRGVRVLQVSTPYATPQERFAAMQVALEQYGIEPQYTGIRSRTEPEFAYDMPVSMDTYTQVSFNEGKTDSLSPNIQKLIQAELLKGNDKFISDLKTSLPMFAQAITSYVGEIYSAYREEIVGDPTVETEIPENVVHLSKEDAEEYTQTKLGPVHSSSIRIPEEGITQGYLDAIIRAKWEDVYRTYVYARMPSGVGAAPIGFFWQMMGQATDPLELGLGYLIPVGKLTKLSGWAKRSGMSMGNIIRRTAYRVEQGLYEGAIAGLITEPFIAASYEEFQREYSLSDFSTNVLINAVLSGTLRAGGGLIADISRRGRAPSAPPASTTDRLLEQTSPSAIPATARQAIAQTADDRVVDIETTLGPVFRQAPASVRLQTLIDADVGAPDIPASAPFLSVTRRATTAAVDDLWRLAQQGAVSEGAFPSPLLQSAQFIREAGGLQTREAFGSFAEQFARASQLGGAQRATSLRNVVDRFVPIREGQRATGVTSRGRQVTGEIRGISRAGSVFLAQPGQRRGVPVPRESISRPEVTGALTFPVVRQKFEPQFTAEQIRQMADESLQTEFTNRPTPEQQAAYKANIDSNKTMSEEQIANDDIQEGEDLINSIQDESLKKELMDFLDEGDTRQVAQEHSKAVKAGAQCKILSGSL